MRRADGDVRRSTGSPRAAAAASAHGPSSRPGRRRAGRPRRGPARAARGSSGKYGAAAASARLELGQPALRAAAGRPAGTGRCPPRPSPAWTGTPRARRWPPPLRRRRRPSAAASPVLQPDDQQVLRELVLPGQLVGPVEVRASRVEPAEVDAVGGPGREAAGQPAASPSAAASSIISSCSGSGGAARSGRSIAWTASRSTRRRAGVAGTDGARRRPPHRPARWHGRASPACRAARRRARLEQGRAVSARRGSRVEDPRPQARSRRRRTCAWLRHPQTLSTVMVSSAAAAASTSSRPSADFAAAATSGQASIGRPRRDQGHRPAEQVLLALRRRWRPGRDPGASAASR